MADEVEITEIHGMNVSRQDAVVTPASGFSWLITKSAAADPEGETVVEDATKDAPVEPTESAPAETSGAPVEKATDAPAAPQLSVEAVQELIKAALAERDSEAEKLIKAANDRADALESELNVLKATPLPGGPVLSATAEQRATKTKNEAMQKAAYYKRLAASVNDRELAVEYTRLAKAAQAEAA